MQPHHKILLRISVLLWVIWGGVHILAGVIVLSSDPSGGFAAIADNVEPSLLQANYHPAIAGILNQHGWNLLWFGLATALGSLFIWRGNRTAIWVTALIGGMADAGYFLFLDLPGHVNFLPGTLMTLVSGTAILLSGWVWVSSKNDKASDHFSTEAS